MSQHQQPQALDPECARSLALAIKDVAQEAITNIMSLAAMARPPQPPNPALGIPGRYGPFEQLKPAEKASNGTQPKK
jgi:hypothetical protein